jgi:hypothetical protein
MIHLLSHLNSSFFWVCLDWLYYKISKHIPSPINIKYSILLKVQARDGVSIHLCTPILCQRGCGGWSGFGSRYEGFKHLDNCFPPYRLHQLLDGLRFYRIHIEFPHLSRLALPNYFLSNFIIFCQNIVLKSFEYF